MSRSVHYAGKDPHTAHETCSAYLDPVSSGRLSDHDQAQADQAGCDETLVVKLHRVSKFRSDASNRGGSKGRRRGGVGPAKKGLQGPSKLWKRQGLELLPT
jgi:hypothetical protein